MTKTEPQSLTRDLLTPPASPPLFLFGSGKDGGEREKEG